jgi:hypothetical protein
MSGCVARDAHDCEGRVVPDWSRLAIVRRAKQSGRSYRPRSWLRSRIRRGVVDVRAVLIVADAANVDHTVAFGTYLRIEHLYTGLQTVGAVWTDPTRPYGTAANPTYIHAISPLVLAGEAFLGRARVVESEPQT